MSAEADSLLLAISRRSVQPCPRCKPTDRLAAWRGLAAEIDPGAEELAWELCGAGLLELATSRLAAGPGAPGPRRPFAVGLTDAAWRRVRELTGSEAEGLCRHIRES